MNEARAAAADDGRGPPRLRRGRRDFFGRVRSRGQPLHRYGVNLGQAIEKPLQRVVVAFRGASDFILVDLPLHFDAFVVRRSIRREWSPVRGSGIPLDAYHALGSVEFGRHSFGPIRANRLSSQVRRN